MQVFVTAALFLSGTETYGQEGIQPQLRRAVRRVESDGDSLPAGMLRLRVLHEPTAVGVGSYNDFVGETPLTLDLPAGENYITIGLTEACVRGVEGAHVLMRLRAGEVEEVRGGSSCGVKTLDIDDGPVFPPFTVQPILLNRTEVSRALSRNYPPQLLDAGVSGEVVVWMLIAADGTVQKSQVKESSRHAEVDAAALRVAPVMRFSPAMNGDQAVKVWVALPIRFSAL